MIAKTTFWLYIFGNLFFYTQSISAAQIDTFRTLESSNVFWVRPKGGIYGKEDGSSYENAWDGFKNIVWGEEGVRPGSTLYICGTHDYKSGFPIEIKQSGKEGKPLTIRGDYPEAPGVLDGGQTVSEWIGPDQYGVYHINTRISHNGLFENGKHLKKASDKSCHDGNYFSDNLRNIHYYKPSKGTPHDKHVILTGANAVVIKNQSFITIRSLKFTYNQNAIFTRKRVSNLNIEKNTFNFLNGSAVKVKDGADGNIRVLGNSMYFMHDGIYFLGGKDSRGAGSGCLIKGNDIAYCNYYNSWKGDGHAIGIQKTSGVIIEYNNVKFCKRPIAFWSNTPENPCADNIVRFNRVEDCKDTVLYDDRPGNGAAFIMVSKRQNCYYGNSFHHNVIVNCTSGFHFTQSALKRPNLIYNNTIVQCETGVYLRKGADHYHILNNIFFFNTRDMYWLGGMNVGLNNKADYNLYYPGKTKSFNFRSETPLNFKDWKRLAKQGHKSMAGIDPGFINSADRDYRLQTDSPARNAGSTIIYSLSDYVVRQPENGTEAYIGAFGIH